MNNRFSENIERKFEAKDSLKNIVAVSFDDKFVYPFLILAHSLRKSSSQEFKIVVANVNQTLGNESIQTILQFCTLFRIPLEFYDVELDFEVQTDSRFSLAAYGRLFLMEIIQSRFLYLDVDGLAHPGWDRIFSDHHEFLDKDGVALVATIAPDAMLTSMQPRYGRNQARKMATSNYFFDMIFLVDPIKLKKIDFSNKWRDAARDYKALGFMQHDQDVLNYILHDTVAPLHPSYNHLHGLPNAYPRFFSSCVGHPKPWTFSEEDKLISTFTWALGNKDLGKDNWIEDFYAYWNYESALFTELTGADFVLKRKMESLRIAHVVRFNDFRAKLKYRFAQILLGR